MANQISQFVDGIATGLIGILIMYCTEKVDEELAEQQAQELSEDKDNFIRILTKASRPQIKVTYNKQGISFGCPVLSV